MANTTSPDKVPDGKVDMRDFGGLASYIDPHDVNPGAARSQVNAASIRPGELRARQGYKRVKFDS